MLTYVICTQTQLQLYIHVLLTVNTATPSCTCTHEHQWLWTPLKINTCGFYLHLYSQIWASNTFTWGCYHPRNSLISLHCQICETFMNRSHWVLEHFSDHTPWCIYYPVQRCLNSLGTWHVNRWSVCFVLFVIDAKTLLVSVSLWLRVGEGRSRGHPAADVAGEGCARGQRDRADCCKIRQWLSQVSVHEMEESLEIVFAEQEGLCYLMSEYQCCRA